MSPVKLPSFLGWHFLLSVSPMYPRRKRNRDTKSVYPRQDRNGKVLVSLRMGCWKAYAQLTDKDNAANASHKNRHNKPFLANLIAISRKRRKNFGAIGEGTCQHPRYTHFDVGTNFFLGQFFCTTTEITYNLVIAGSETEPKNLRAKTHYMAVLRSM